jgi:hypothetical protein
VGGRRRDALLAHGIGAPEWLLFMTETELQNISGIDAISLGEILWRKSERCTTHMESEIVSLIKGL